MRALKSLGLALMAVATINVAALGGLAAWLGATGRLNKKRVQRIVSVFDDTIADDKAQREKAKDQAQKEKQKAERAARLERVKDGPVTMQDRLTAKQRADEIAMHRLNRMEEETSDLRQQIERAKNRIAEQNKALQKKREKFEKFLKKRTEELKQEDFQQTVQMYESLDADKTKRMFQQLLNEGKEDQVVKYLAAMQQRAASGVLQAFETPQEVQQATQLLERLRQRGVHPLAEDALQGGDQP
jgi:chromosome segregation ATPase